MTLTPSRKARLASGFTPEAAARKAGITTAYLLRMERTQRWPEWHARTLARAYGVSMDFFRAQPGRAVQGADARTGAGGRHASGSRGMGR